MGTYLGAPLLQLSTLRSVGDSFSSTCRGPGSRRSTMIALTAASLTPSTPIDGVGACWRKTAAGVSSRL
ncbi:MAG: hypothetical protein VXW32_00250 [Myxococcota bacterium]|nr:hypothetical protein [Myxococcota bacterium]